MLCHTRMLGSLDKNIPSLLLEAEPVVLHENRASTLCRNSCLYQPCPHFFQKLLYVEDSDNFLYVFIPKSWRDLLLYEYQLHDMYSKIVTSLTDTDCKSRLYVAFYPPWTIEMFGILITMHKSKAAI